MNYDSKSFNCYLAYFFLSFHQISKDLPFILLLRRPKVNIGCALLSISIFSRRVDSLNLETPYHSDYDPMTNRYPIPEAYIEGQELYLHFFHEQVRNAGLLASDEVHSLEEDFG